MCTMIFDKGLYIIPIAIGIELHPGKAADLGSMYLLTVLVINY